jgi:hypothetical protein
MNFSKLTKEELNEIYELVKIGYDSIPRRLIKITKEKFNLYLPTIKKNHPNFYFEIINEVFISPHYYINNINEIDFEEQ